MSPGQEAILHTIAAQVPSAVEILKTLALGALPLAGLLVGAWLERKKQRDQAELTMQADDRRWEREDRIRLHAELKGACVDLARYATAYGVGSFKTLEEALTASEKMDVAVHEVLLFTDDDVLVQAVRALQAAALACGAGAKHDPKTGRDLSVARAAFVIAARRSLGRSSTHLDVLPTRRGGEHAPESGASSTR